MKVLVAIKRGIDYHHKVQAKVDGTGILDQNLSKGINPFDEVALEAAVRLKEQGVAKEVIALTIGDKSCEDVLRKALALGADSAILVSSNTTPPLNRAKVIAHIISTKNISLALLGTQAIDDDCAQTAPMVAALLDWPQATSVSNIVLTENTLTVTRETDHGATTLELQMPAVVSVGLNLNTPRFASLPDIIKARHQPIEILDANSMPIEWVTPYRITTIQNAPVRTRKRQTLESVQALIDKLQSAAKVS